MTKPSDDYLDDADRLAALLATGLMDSSPEQQFDRLTRLTSRLLNVPVSLVSLVDGNRQFFKSRHGPVEQSETPLSHSFCQHVVIGRAPLIVEDAESDARVCDNLAIPELGVRAYLGVPLRTAQGHVLGSLCAIDVVTRSWSDQDLATLQDFAAIVMSEVELRHEVVQRKEAEQSQKLLIGELHHRVKNNLASVQSLVQLTLNSATSLTGFGESVNARLASLAKTHDLLVGQRWKAVDLGDLIRGELASQDRPGRLVLEGPKVSISSDIAANMGMVFHELATNAMKYGSLSSPEGTLRVEWRIEPATDRPNSQVLTVRWQESGGPAVVDNGRRGFGSKLLTQLVRGQFSGEADMLFDPAGLQFRAVMTIPDIAAAD